MNRKEKENLLLVYDVGIEIGDIINPNNIIINANDEDEVAKMIAGEKFGWVKFIFEGRIEGADKNKISSYSNVSISADENYGKERKAFVIGLSIKKQYCLYRREKSSDVSSKRSSIKYQCYKAKNGKDLRMHI